MAPSARLLATKAPPFHPSSKRDARAGSPHAEQFGVDGRPLLCRPPPKKMTAMDLRVLVSRMQEGGAMDWSVLRFVGTDRAYEMVMEGQRQEEERPPPLLADDEPPPLE